MHFEREGTLMSLFKECFFLVGLVGRAGAGSRIWG